MSTPAKKVAKKKVAKKPAARKRAAAPKVVTATLHILGMTYTATGASSLEALESLQIGRAPRVKAVLVVTDGVKTVEKVLSPIGVLRLFSLSPRTRQMQLKNFYFMLPL